MRERIFQIIQASKDDDKLSKAYDIFMIIIIILSLLPITIKNPTKAIYLIDLFTTVIFIIDYILRFITADLKLCKGKKSYIVYPFTPMAIIDLLSILPSVLAVNNALRVLKIFRFLRALKVFRVFKVVRYFRSVTIIVDVFKKQKDSLLVVGGLAVGYILVSALVMISIEPETFPTFFDAIYWATISLTTVGYGDIYAVSTLGKIITMLSSLFGIAIVALPAGILTAGYMNELNKHKDKE